jgi:TctA family transporter
MARRRAGPRSRPRSARSSAAWSRRSAHAACGPAHQARFEVRAAGVLRAQLVGLSLVNSLASRSILLALILAVIGLLIAMVGIDPVARSRASRSGARLMSGINVVIVAMGPSAWARSR